MQEIIIIALAIGAAYWLTHQSKTNSQSTQTEPLKDNAELTNALTTLLHNLQTLNQTI